MRYAEHAPAPALRGAVRCVWIGEDPAPEDVAQPVVGDGCPELIAHFGVPMRERAEDGTEHEQPRTLVAGQLTRPLWLRPSGPVGVVGVRFLPWAAYRFVRRPMAELTDRRVALDALDIDGAEALARALAAASGDEARLEVVQSYVADRLAPVEPEDDELLERCVRLLDAARPGPEGDDAALSIDALAHGLGVGRRRLERRFAEHVGVSPRALAGILRLRRFFDLLDHDSAPLLDAALAAGYYDQSHFAREFRRYAGLTATEFLATRPALASAIFDVANVQASPRPLP